MPPPNLVSKNRFDILPLEELEGHEEKMLSQEIGTTTKPAKKSRRQRAKAAKARAQAAELTTATNSSLPLTTPATKALSTAEEGKPESLKASMAMTVAGVKGLEAEQARKDTGMNEYGNEVVASVASIVVVYVLAFSAWVGALFRRFVDGDKAGSKRHYDIAAIHILAFSAKVAAVLGGLIYGGKAATKRQNHKAGKVRGARV